MQIIKGRDIIIVGLQPWDTEIGSNCKDIALEFSKNNRVLYVNSPLDRISKFRHKNTSFVKKRVALLKDDKNNLDYIQPNLWVYYPDVILESINWIKVTAVFNWLNIRNNRKFSQSIKKAIDKLEMKDFILFNDNDIFRSFYLKEYLQPAISLYYSRDYLLGTTYWKHHGIKLEPLLMAKSDICVANSSYLTHLCKIHNKNSYYIGQGCEVDAFLKADDHAVPDQMKRIAEPIIGYVGALTAIRLDIALLVQLAKEKPQWSIVLVGPEDETFEQSELHHLENVHFSGTIDPGELPSYIATFTVCINPQLVNELTIGNYPRKIDEYLAAGKPVVATRTKAMDEFKAYCYLASDTSEYIQHIEEAIVSDSPSLNSLRKQFASSHTWENSVEKIYAAIHEYTAENTSTLNATENKRTIYNKHFLSLTTNVFTAGCAMLTFMLLLRAMKIEQMGYWIFFQTTLSLLDTFRSGFLQMALIKFYSGAKKPRAKEVLGSVWYLALAITLFWFVVSIPAFLLLPYIENMSIQIVIKWFAVIFLLTLPYSITLWRLQADQKFKTLLSLAMINQFSLIIFIVILMVVGKVNIVNLLYVNALSASISSAICLISGWSGLRYIVKKSRDCMKEVYHFGKFSVGTSISTNLLRSSDVFMINFLLGPALIPVYNVAQRLMEIVEIPLRSFLVTAMPNLSAAFNQKRNHDVVAIMEKYAGMLTLALLPVALIGIVFADVAVALLGGGKYLGTDAANIFRIFIVLSIIYPIDRFSGVTLDIINQPKRNFYKVIMMLIINVIGNYIGILLFDNLYGVVLSSVLSFSVGLIYSYTSLQEFLTFNIKGILNTGAKEVKYLYLKLF